MEKMKRNKGITLISLIITIIILIILAGISINMILGNEGLLNKAKYAKEGYSNAQKQEAIEIAKLTNQINGNIEGNRETITISKDEYDILKNANTYSTDEKIIGTWIDGKPIYQKTISINRSMPSKSMSVEIDYIPVETLINIDCIYTANMNNGKGAFCMASSRGEIIYNNNYSNEGKAELQIIQTQTSGNTSYLVACIMQYTKTTNNE